MDQNTIVAKSSPQSQLPLCSDLVPNKLILNFCMLYPYKLFVMRHSNNYLSVYINAIFYLNAF